ncbi:hypothetical protein [Streptomyces sp. NBC_00271]|uniref:hypothetical protein n=1 Tax=Streptomyces sp. NBC_00271 TaxID=2975697 RepID=UPI002E2CA757|nr:hypothetical protein [Streptomyces sp. NBC_00271]
MAETTKAARPERAAPGRRIVAAGIIRRTPDRTITVRVTQAGATGVIAKQVTR